MGELQYYHSLSEKDSVFTTRRIDTEAEFDDFFIYATEQTGCYWRGVAQAKFKFYSSLQRYWISNDKPNDVNAVEEYLKLQRKKILEWRGGIIPRYLKVAMNERYPSIFSLLSIMRHYEVPTPCTDWTTDPSVALYFMSDSKSTGEEIEIDQYSSIYLLDRDHPWVHFDIKSNLLTDSEMKSIKKIFRSFPDQKFESAKKLGIEIEDLGDEWLMKKKFCESVALGYAANHDGVALRIEDKPGDVFSWGISNNLNLISQKGLFLYHVEPNAPLEEFPSRLIENYARRQGSLSSLKSLEQREIGAKEVLKGVLCYNINNKLHSYIRNKVGEAPWNINATNLFPDLNKLAEELFLD